MIKRLLLRLLLGPARGRKHCPCCGKFMVVATKPKRVASPQESFLTKHFSEQLMDMVNRIEFRRFDEMASGGTVSDEGNPSATVPVSDVVHDALGEFCAESQGVKNV